MEIYEDYKSANQENLMIRKILFIDVKNISHTEERQGAIVTIKMQKDDELFLLYADSQQSTMKWYRYCSLLLKIPKCDIPEIPKESIALRQTAAGIDSYGELHKCDTGTCMYVYSHVLYMCIYIYTYVVPYTLACMWAASLYTCTVTPHA